MHASMQLHPSPASPSPCCPCAPCIPQQLQSKSCLWYRGDSCYFCRVGSGNGKAPNEDHCLYRFHRTLPKDRALPRPRPPHPPRDMTDEERSLCDEWTQLHPVVQPERAARTRRQRNAAGDSVCGGALTLNAYGVRRVVVRGSAIKRSEKTSPTLFRGLY